MSDRLCSFYNGLGGSGFDFLSGSSGRRGNWSSCLSLDLRKVGKSNIFVKRSVVFTSVLLDVFLATLDALLSLFVHGLELTNSDQIVDSWLILLDSLVSETSSKVGFDQDVEVRDEKRAINDLGAELNLLPVLSIFTVTESNVAKDGSLKLKDLFLEDRKVFVGDLEDLSGVLVKLDGFGVRTLFKLDLSFLLSDFNLCRDLVELRLHSLFLLVVESC